MTVQLDSHTEELIGRLPQAVSSALDAAGHSAESHVRHQMLTGYAQPVLDTGALMDSISHIVEENTLHVGSPLSYAGPVHDGTAFVSGKPYLQDGMLAAAEDMASAIARELAAALP